MLRQFRFHGRGGQGAVIGAELLARAAFYDGKWSQAFPFFGAERRGAPIKAFARISDREILLRSQIYDPDYVVVFDPDLFEMANVLEGLKKGGMIVINSKKIPDELGPGFRVAIVNATDIALELNALVAGMPVVNTAMLGAVAKATGEITIESILRSIANEWSGKSGEVNLACAKKAYESVLGGD